VTGSGRATAKLTAAEEALDFIQSRCPSIIYKRTAFDDSPAGNAVGRDNVLEEGAARYIKIYTLFKVTSLDKTCF